MVNSEYLAKCKVVFGFSALFCQRSLQKTIILSFLFSSLNDRTDFRGIAIGIASGGK